MVVNVLKYVFELNLNDNVYSQKFIRASYVYVVVVA